MKEKKLELKFDKIFDATAKEYRANLKSITIILLIFIALPLVAINAAELFWFFTDQNVQTFGLNPDMDIESLSIPYAYWVSVGAFALLYLFCNLFAVTGITMSSLEVKKNKYEMSNFSANAKAGFLRYLGLIVLEIFVYGAVIILGGSLAFILFFNTGSEWLAALIFAPFLLIFISIFIYWLPAVYAMYDEKISVFAAIKRSVNLVKKRWWQVFLYVFIVMVIVMLLQGIIEVPVTSQQIQIEAGTMEITPGIYLFHTIYTTITDIIMMFAYPFTIIFFKNIYLALKNKKK